MSFPKSFGRELVKNLTGAANMDTRPRQQNSGMTLPRV